MNKELKEPHLGSGARPRLQPRPNLRFHEAASELAGLANPGLGTCLVIRSVLQADKKNWSHFSVSSP